jgi:hypothetical protein
MVAGVPRLQLDTRAPELSENTSPELGIVQVMFDGMNDFNAVKNVFRAPVGIVPVASL